MWSLEGEPSQDLGVVYDESHERCGSEVLRLPSGDFANPITGTRTGKDFRRTDNEIYEGSRINDGWILLHPRLIFDQYRYPLKRCEKDCVLSQDRSWTP